MQRRTRNVGCTMALGMAMTLASAPALAQQPAPAERNPGAAEPPAANPPAADAPAADDAPATDTVEPAAAVAPALPPAAADITKRFDAVVAQSGGLTSDQVAQRAVATDWTIKSLEKGQQIADLNVNEAVAAYLPEVRLTARYTRLSPVESGTLGGGGGDVTLVQAGDALPRGSNYPTDYDGFSSFPLSALTSGFEFPTFLNNYHLQASLSVPISDYVLRAGHGLNAAKHNKRFAKLNREAEALSTSANAKLVYYDWVRAELQLVVVEQSHALAKEQLRVSRAGFAGGRLSKADVLASEARLANAELIVSQVRNLATLTEDRVRTIMHDDAPGEYSVGEDAMNGPVPARPVETFDQLYDEALQNRLEMKALESNKKSIEEASDTFRADNYPRVAAFGNAYYVNPSQRVFPQEDRFRAQWDVGVELTWTPTKIATARAETRKYDLQAQQRESDIQNFRDSLRTQVLQARQEMLVAALNIETAQRGLAAAEEGYRVRSKLYEFGRATRVEVDDAEKQLLQARLAVVNARLDVVTAKVRLDHAVGRDVATQR